MSSCCPLLYFNPRSREGSDDRRPPLFNIQRYFNPRSREGSDFLVLICFLSMKISIHAPAKGATEIRASCAKFSTFQSTLPRRERQYALLEITQSVIFQSTLPRRERHGIKTITDAFAEFQSTLPRRERLLPEHRLHRLLQISIHAPAKGATAEWMLWEIDHRNFNPRSREGSDPKAGANQDQR